MTDEEERLLKQYLNINSQDFEDWYLERFSSDEADWEYKCVLAEAKAFEAGKARSYREIYAVLDSYDHPAGCACHPCKIVRHVAERLEEHQNTAPGPISHHEGPLLWELDQPSGVMDCG